MLSLVSLRIFLADIEILFIKVIYLTSKAIAHDLMAFFGRSWNFKDMFLSPSCLRKAVKGMTPQTLQARRYSFWLTSLLFGYLCSTKLLPFVSYSSENTEIGVNLCKVFYGTILWTLVNSVKSIINHVKILLATSFLVIF